MQTRVSVLQVKPEAQSAVEEQDFLQPLPSQTNGEQSFSTPVGLFSTVGDAHVEPSTHLPLASQE